MKKIYFEGPSLRIVVTDDVAGIDSVVLDFGTACSDRLAFCDDVVLEIIEALQTALREKTPFDGLLGFMSVAPVIDVCERKRL
jgi:hypothetical protein